MKRKAIMWAAYYPRERKPHAVFDNKEDAEDWVGSGPERMRQVEIRVLPAKRKSKRKKARRAK